MPLNFDDLLLVITTKITDQNMDMSSFNQCEKCTAKNCRVKIVHSEAAKNEVGVLTNKRLLLYRI